MYPVIGKGIMLEEATRVPLIVSFPGQIPAGRIVKEPVSHIDLFATIMDYTGASTLHRSDGTSLRRYIEKRSWNERYDERVAVVELDKRIPINDNKFSGRLGDIPNLMIRSGNYKLALPKNAESSRSLDLVRTPQCTLAFISLCPTFFSHSTRIVL